MTRGFFGAIPEFDEFLNTFVKPVMLDSGFRASGRKYVLRGDDGSAVVVHPALFTPPPGMSFHIEWAAIPSILRDYIVDGHPSWRPSLRWGLVCTRLTVPIAMRERRYESTLWVFASENRTAYGQALQGFLVDDAIPKWRQALTREYLVTAHETDPDLKLDTGAMRPGPHWVKAILGADNGDPVEGARAIDFMAEWNERDPMIPWLHNRLASRLAGSPDR